MGNAERLSTDVQLQLISHLPLWQLRSDNGKLPVLDLSELRTLQATMTELGRHDYVDGEVQTQSYVLGRTEMIQKLQQSNAPVSTSAGFPPAQALPAYISREALHLQLPRDRSNSSPDSVASADGVMLATVTGIAKGFHLLRRG